MRRTTALGLLALQRIRRSRIVEDPATEDNPLAAAVPEIGLDPEVAGGRSPALRNRAASHRRSMLQDPVAHTR